MFTASLAGYVFCISGKDELVTILRTNNQYGAGFLPNIQSAEQQQ